LHALIDHELDPANALAVETHLANCPRCSAQRRQYEDLSGALSKAVLRYQAPLDLLRRVEASIKAPVRTATDRRSLLKGFAMGSMISAAMAASLAVVVFNADADERILDDGISAHLRSLQANHLIDVASTDQHTVKPWFNGKFDVSPPVPDLTAEGFRLIGGRLDYIDEKPVAVIVYKRRAHIINLFVSKALGLKPMGSRSKSIRGFNTLYWSEQGLDMLAISDINTDELAEFAGKFQAASRTVSR
jgi:anti-sigma factor RsiW